MKKQLTPSEILLQSLGVTEPEEIDLNVADVTGIEYLDVYKVILNNGGKQWTTT